MNITFFKNPNWQEADQLAIYKCSQRVGLGATNLETHQLVRHFNFLAMLPSLV